jgi:prefoldin alpha subunit
MNQNEIKITQNEWNKLLLELDELGKALLVLKDEIQLFDNLIEENTNAIEFLSKMNEKYPLDESLFPLGGDIYVHTAVTDPTKVVMGAGNGIYVETSPEKAYKSIDDRLSKLKTKKEAEQKRYEEMQARYNEIDSLVRTISAQRKPNV